MARGGIMKFKEYVKNMVEELEKNPEIGEMETISSTDDEGNGFNEVHMGISVGIWNETYNGDFISHEDDIQDMKDDGLDVVFNAVCIN
jgi:hypothetical protein